MNEAAVQKKFWQWKESQGLSYSGQDVAQGDTVQAEPLTPTEKQFREAGALAYLIQHSGQFQR